MRKLEGDQVSANSAEPTLAEGQAPKLEHPENNFTAIRLILASMVIFAHSAELLDGNRTREPLSMIFGTLSLGEVAVNCFFIVSGYLLINSWNRDPNLFRFMARRVLRIYPGFLVAFFISALVVGRLGAGPGYFGTMYWKKLGITAFTLGVPETPPTFVGSHYAGVNTSMWTIGPEFVCYVLLAVAGVLTLSRWKWFWPSAWIIFAGVLAYISSLPNFSEPNSFARFFAFFAAGAAMAVLNVRTVRYVIPLLALVVIGLCWEITAYTFMSLFGAALVITLAHSRVKFLGRMSKLPDISYGIYLYAFPVQKLIILWWPTVPILALDLLTLATTIVLGYLSWNLIEKPFLRFKPGTRKSANLTVDSSASTAS